MMPLTMVALIAFLAILSTGPIAGLQSDERALAIADEMMEAMGGQENWDAARFIRFTFSRRGRTLNITWDRQTGRYRLEAKNEAGVPYVVLMNINTRQGKVYVDGEELRDGRELSNYLNRALRMWHGETYWFLMPFKWKDDGVILAYEGQERIGSVDYEVVHLGFDDVGLTPGDEFWAYVNPETHLMDRWKFLLESGTEGEYEWTGWERIGGILLATERVSAEERILFEGIVVADRMPDSLFHSPAAVTFP